MLRVLSWMILLLAGGIAQAYTVQVPMTPAEAAQKCVDENASPWAPGTQVVTPGLWVRPGNRGGSSWDLVWSDDRQSLKVILYTYDYQGRPSWFASKMTLLQADGTWKASLYKYVAPNTQQAAVGSLAIRFFPNDPTRLAMSWDWDGLHSNGVTAPVQKECLGNFIEVSPTRSTNDSSPTSDGPEQSSYTGVLVNELFSGYWNGSGSTNPDAVPGMSLNILQSTFPTSGTPGTFVEFNILLTFDSTGQPVWLAADMPSPACSAMVCAAPPLTSAQGKLLYFQPNKARYAHGVPVETCTTNDCTYPGQEIGHIFRNVTNNAGTLGNIRVSDLANPSNLFDTSTAQQLVSANFFPPVGTQTSTLKKITQSTGIRPVQYSCKTGSAAQTATCTIWVPWNASSGTPTPWRHNLNDNTYHRLSTNSTGEVVDALHAGERVAYELWSGPGTDASTPSGTLVGHSAEVRGYGPLPSNGDSNNGPPATPQAPAAFVPPTLDDASDLIGAISADFRVDEGGNANYRVPLAVPPGRGGLAPTLALTYNSSGGMGYFGTGFSLEGTSAIVPCRPGKEFGDTDEPTAVASVFCLDGQRLLLQSGTDRAQGAVYRTEIETFQKVVIQTVDTLNVSGVTLNSFTFAVYGKDGSVHTYGGSAGTVASTCMTCAGTPLAATAWLQTQLADVAGNAIAYNYSSLTSSGERYLDTVSYVGGLVKFNYIDASGIDTSFATVLAGASPRQGRMQRSKLVQSIDVSSDSALFRHYVLAYEDPFSLGTGQVRARLSSLKECADVAGTKCYPATTFDWNDSAMTVQDQSATSLLFRNIKAYKFGDFNGDHRSDIAWIDEDHTLYVASANSAAAGIGFSSTAYITTMPGNVNYGALWEVLDVNADGRDDVVYAQISGATLQWYVRYALATGGFDVAQPLGGVTQVLPAVRDPGDPGDSAAALKGASMLADFDGDGLPDLLYAGPDASSYSIALLNKPVSSGQPYAFASAISAAFYNETGSACSLASVAFGKEDAARTDAIDIDGDGRADVHFVLEQTSPCSGATAGLQSATGSTDDAPQSPTDTRPFYLKTFRSQGVQAGVFRFQAYNWLNMNFSLRDDSAGAVFGRFRMVDMNGDGLVDIVFRTDDIGGTGHVWKYALAGWKYDLTGPNQVPCVVAGCALQSTEHGGVLDAQIQLQDFDGDGKLDFWYPNNGVTNDPNPYRVYLWQGNGFASNPVITNSSAGSDEDWMGLSADFDGDGVADQMKIKVDGDQASWHVTRSTSHHVPRNVIGKIINGLGAVTEIDYAPLSFSSVYHRDYNAPWVAYGRGSTVFDVASPNSVVQYVSSSAPAYTAPGYTTVVQYFYAGLKVQAGGRGSLGFRRVSSFDYQTSMEVDTTYSTQFPTIGAAKNTTTRYFQGTFPVDPCLNGNADSSQCMARSPECAGGLGTTCDTDLPTATQVMRKVTDLWYWRSQPLVLSANNFVTLGIGAPPASNSSTTVRQNMFTSRVSSNTVTTDYNGVAMTNETTSFDTAKFDDFGNPGKITTTKVGGGVTLSTQSAFIYSNDVPNWKLGRLQTTKVLNQRSPGATNARQSTFTYNAVGMLASEKVEGMNGTSLDALTVDTTATGTATYYGYDAFGNRNATFTCSAGIIESTCRSISGGSSFYVFHPVNDHGITRYTKSDYDSLGRYVNAVHEGFSTGGLTSVDRIVSQVTARNAGGDPLTTVDVNGVTTQVRYGVMGRKRYMWSSTGASSRTDYAACTATNCPPSLALAYVATTTTSGAPTTKVFYDILGRQVLGVTTGFAGESIATMTGYDNRGNPYRKSQPYIAQDGSSHASVALAGTQISWNRTDFDGLARPTRIFQPDLAQTAYAYAGLTTTTTLPTNGSGQVQTKVETRDPVGNVISTTDSNGLVVSYTYDGYGQLTDVVRAGLTTHTIYDSLGRKKSTSDPDTGTWTYTVDDAGQVTKQVSPRLTCTQSSYDARGRVWQRSDFATGDCSGTADTVSEWQFDTLSYGVGKLALEKDTVGGVVKVQRTPQYDGYGRPVAVTTALDGKTYIDQSSYDQYGRAFQTFFTAPGFPTTGELYEYNAYGYQNRLRSAYPASNSMVYYEAQAMDAFGHVTAEQRSSMAQMLTERTYDPKTGRLLTIQSGGGVSQDLTYTYDGLGNMTSRRDQTGSMNFGGGRDLYEQFAYDNLQRLTTSTVTTGLLTPPSLTMGYDNEGNITSRAIAGSASASYLYQKNVPAYCNTAGPSGLPLSGLAPAGPHAVTQVGTASYCYDADGNVIGSSDGGRKIVYSPYDLPLTISSTTNDTKVGFEYGPNREKIRRLDYPTALASSATDVTHYVGSAELHLISGSLREVRRYLGALILVQSGAGSSYRIDRQYFLTDAQGSTFAVLSDWGVPVNANAAMSFDPFGARRDDESGQIAPWTPSLEADLDASTHHGYTGHEQVDSVGVIHMNGRIYDPKLGRFLQADPYVQDATNSQSLNRYSYVLNNPMAFTDPTGYWGHRQQGYLRTAVAIVISVWTGGAAAGLAAEGAWGSAMAVAFAGGFAAGGIQSGSGKGALMGGVTAMVFTGINGSFAQIAKDSGGSLSTAQYAERALANGAAGGVLASIQGQRFGSGFASAGLSSTLNPAVDSVTSNPYGQGFMAAVVGGTVSEATGGKFANGAITGAFANAIGQVSAMTVGSGGPGSTEAGDADADAYLRNASTRSGQLVPLCYGSASAAQAAAGNAYLGASLLAHREAAWWTYDLGMGSYSYTYPSLGGVGSEFGPLPDALSGYTIESGGHTHWTSNYKLSPQDWRVMTQGQKSGQGYTLYLAGGDGHLQYGTPAYARSFGVTVGARFLPPSASFPGIPVNDVQIKTSFP